MHAQKFSAYADVRSTRSERVKHTLCERSARPQNGSDTLTVRRQRATTRRHHSQRVAGVLVARSWRSINVLSACLQRTLTV